MRVFSQLVRFGLRFLALWFADGLSLWATSALLPGFTLQGVGGTPKLVVAFAAAFLLGIVNLLIRPLILLLARPLGFIALFIIGFFVNAIALYITAWLLPGFTISSIFAAILGGVLFSAVNIVLTGILEIDDEGSFYQSYIERVARKQGFKGADIPGRGLVMMEIDGLSFHHIRAAIATGLMPTLKRMLEEDGFTLSRVDCGIPSQTSACQAGIMYGDNHDIPAFRWYDKDRQKLIVSSKDATELNARYATGHGLLRDGSSIGNMMNGDATKSLLTLAGLQGASPEESRLRADDVYLLMLNPYFLMRTIVLFLGEVGRELWQGLQQRLKNVTPRLNRLHGGYPFIRAATTVVVRDISANLTILDIIRGVPSIYVTWPGYDEVAHHSGPWTGDALETLGKYDRVVGRVKRAIDEKAPRPYDLIILSDHGQSFGATFKQRYGLSLKEFIEQHLPQGTTVTLAGSGDTGATSLAGMSGELKNLQQQGAGSAAGRAVARQGQKLLDEGAESQEAEVSAEHAQVTAYGSGNLAQVYFDLFPRKIALSELNAAYPGMVDALVQHEGIGIVCGYEEDPLQDGSVGAPIVLSKTGKRNLHTGEVSGEDPLKQYAPDDPNAFGAASIATRAWQVRRVMDFPHAGDLMVISPVYPDGTVAALEELIGSHGGLGGEQTDAFLFHPAGVAVTETRNSTDVFHILNAVRDRPVSPADTAKPLIPGREPEAWSRSTLWAGMRQAPLWLGRAARSIFLDRSAYKEVANDIRMTGPGLLIGLAMSAASALIRSGRFGEIPVGATVAVTMLAWLVSVFAIFLAGRFLGENGSYTRTLRTLGFARSVVVIEFLAFVPGLAPLALPLATVVGFLATWLAASEAHAIRGWRTVIFPILYVVILFAGPIVLLLLLGGATYTVTGVLERLGIVPQ